MSDEDPETDPEVTELIADLTRELRRLQREVEPDRGPGSRSVRRDLARFTSEVAIPGLILLLRTNIRALELLRRAIRIADGRSPQRTTGGSGMRDRAEKLGSVTLSQLDNVLGELQSTVEEREGDRAQDLISDAREIREQIQDELDTDGEAVDSVDIDVEAELRSLKDDLDDADETTGGDGRGDDTEE
jgi:hypothetical protein